MHLLFRQILTLIMTLALWMLLPNSSFMKSPKPPAIERWGVVAKLYLVPRACLSHMLTRYADKLTLDYL